MLEWRRRRGESGSGKEADRKYGGRELLDMLMRQEKGGPHWSWGGPIVIMSFFVHERRIHVQDV